jgi:hypothetical protein
MSFGAILAAAALAQVADAPAESPAAAEPVHAYGPVEPAPPKVAANAAPARKACSPETPEPDSDTIVVCVVKPEGYRIDPDVLAAKKAERQADQGRPLSRAEKVADTGGPVGPQYGCMGPQCVNLLAVALTAAQIAQRAAKGQEIGSVFRTDPQMSEYEYYQLAKAEREKREAEESGDGYLAQIEAEKAASRR